MSRGKVKKKEDFVTKEPEITNEECKELELKLMQFKQKKIDGVLVAAIEQYAAWCGASLLQGHEVIVRDPSTYRRIMDIDEKRKFLNNISTERALAKRGPVVD